MNRKTIMELLIENNYRNVYESAYYFESKDFKFPNQGWKIHISVNLNNYVEIINLVIPYLVNKRIAFKIIKDINIYKKNSLKTGNRESYGKFITVYPFEEEFVSIIEELYNILKDFEGPYILSDRRYKDCRVLYYRYGSNFIEDKIYDKKGNLLRYYKHNDNFIIDMPRPYFYLPEGLKDPITDNYDISSSDILFKKYDVKNAIKFSPVGGVYNAITRSDDKKVIIKEYYPFTELIDENFSSQDLFNIERENFLITAKYSFIPNLLDVIYDWELKYMVIKKVNEYSLDKYFSSINPFITFEDGKKIKNFLSEVFDIAIKIFKNICILLNDGYIITDLSPDNIIVEDKEVFFIDIESLSKIKNGKIDSKINNFTKGFWNNDLDLNTNIKLFIKNIILYSILRNNIWLDTLSTEELLNSLTNRYKNFYILIQLIDNITNQDLEKLDNYLFDAKSKIAETNFNKKLNLNLEKREINYFDFLKRVKIAYEKEKDNAEFNIDNSFSQGIIGLNYVENILKKESFNNIDKTAIHVGNYFYGLAGLLYFESYFGLENYDTIDKILENIDCTDFSLSTGISGIGISLIYSLYKNDNINILYKNKIKKYIELIYEKIVSHVDDIEKLNTQDEFSLNEGILGDGLFLIYYKKYTKDKDKLNTINLLIDKIIKYTYRRYKFYKGFNFISESNTKFDYYISNGIMGLVNLILTDYNINENTKYLYIAEKYLDESIGIYTESTSFFKGCGGLLYTYFKAKKILSTDKYNQFIDILVSDIESKYLNDKIEFFNQESIKYLYGDLGTILVLNNIKKDIFEEIFPFVELNK